MQQGQMGDVPIRPIGRLDLIDDVLAQLRDGGVVGLVGEPGIGKTTVWRACVEQSAATWRWASTCFEAEAGLGLAVLGDLFAAAPDAVLDRLPPPQRKAVDVVLLRSDAGADAIDVRLLGSTTASIIEALCSHGSVLIAIDDLHWCDQTSFAAIHFALRRLDHRAVSFLGARRKSELDPLPRERALEVTALTADQTTRMVHDAAPHLRPRTMTRIVEVSGGNPLYALELARAAPSDATEVRVPPSLQALLTRRFAPLPQPCRTALLDIAVRGALPDEEVLGPAHKLGILVGAGPDARFAHPMLAEAVREEATPAQLRAAHRRAAPITADPVARARHAAFATAGPDEELAQSLDTAVAVALRRGDVPGARELAELALACTPDGARPIERVAALARCESGLSNDRAAHALADELVARASDAQTRFLGLMILTRTSPLADAVGYAERAEQLAGMDDEERLEATAERAKLVFLSGRGSEAERILVAALAEAAPASRVWPSLTAYLAISRRQSGRPHDAAQLDAAVELDRRGLAKPSGAALEVAAHIATYDDRHAEARKLFEEAAERSSAATDPGYAVDVQLSRLELRVGNLRQARAAAERISEARADDRRRRDLATLARICAWEGDYPAAHAAIADARAVQRETSDPRTRVAIEGASGFLNILEGDTGKAWEALSAAADTLEELGIREPSTTGVLPLAAEAACAMGKLDDASALCARLAEQAHTLRSGWAAAGVLICQGHIAAARHDSVAAELFDDAAAAYDQLGLPLDRARALFASASVLRRAGHRGAARSRLQLCRELFDGCGARDLASRVERDLARVDGRREPEPDALTAAERQTAALAASGLRNSEIGIKLQISARTVERHLGQVYRKLGVRGRGELAALLGERHQPVT